MPSITALIHTENDALRLGRCLETLYPCDEILIVDHGSTDGTLKIAREYGARIVPASASSPKQYSPAKEWIFALDPRESLTEALAASLFEWKSLPVNSLPIDASPAAAFSVFLREETATGWLEVPVAQTRLVPQAWNRWVGKFPDREPLAAPLEGELLRFAFP